MRRIRTLLRNFPQQQLSVVGPGGFQGPVPAPQPLSLIGVPTFRRGLDRTWCFRARAEQGLACEQGGSAGGAIPEVECGGMASFTIVQPGLMGRGVVGLGERDYDGFGLLYYEVGEESLGVAFKASRQHDCGFKKRWSSDTEAGGRDEL